METGKFLWVSRSYRGGASEIEIVRQELFPHMYPEEQLLADRLFRYCTRFITAKAYDCPLTELVNSRRSLVERRIGLLKHFRISETVFRSQDLELHARLVHLAARLINFVNQ